MSITRLMTTALPIATVVAASLSCADRPDAALDSTLTEAAVEVQGWQLDGEPAVYVGDELYELVNGGAEVYHQLGFDRALAADYVDAEGRTLALEVFAMGDIDGAHAIFSDKAGGSGDAVDIGDEAAVESYYMNARTGRFLVTITGFESDQTTADGMLELARAVTNELGGRP